jgi:hypothetical protein
VTGAGRTVVYSAIFGGYDTPMPHYGTEPDTDYVLLTDTPPRWRSGWTLRPPPPAIAELPPNLANRWCKFFPHRLFPEAQVSVYLDGNILIRSDLDPLVEAFRASGATMALFPHHARTDVASEIEACVALAKLDPATLETARAQQAHYRALGMPADAPLSENAILFRRHDRPELDRAMALWWDELLAWTSRDQLSLPFVLHRTGLSCHWWPWSYRLENPVFVTVEHGWAPSPLHRAHLLADKALKHRARHSRLWRGGYRAYRAGLDLLRLRPGRRRRR